MVESRRNIIISQVFLLCAKWDLTVTHQVSTIIPMLKKRNCSSKRFNNFTKFIQTARGKAGFNLTLGWLQSLFSSHSSSGFGPQSHSQIWEAILACPLLGCYSAEMHSNSRWDAAIWGCRVRVPCAMALEKHLHTAGLSHRASLLHLARWMQTRLFYNVERYNPRI